MIAVPVAELLDRDLARWGMAVDVDPDADSAPYSERCADVLTLAEQWAQPTPPHAGGRELRLVRRHPPARRTRGVYRLPRTRHATHASAGGGPMTRHRRGESISADQARAETAELMDEVDRQRADEDTGPRLAPYLGKPATTPTALPDAGPAIDVTQPIYLVPDRNRLETASRLIGERGLASGMPVDFDGCLCPIAALALAAGGHENEAWNGNLYDLAWTLPETRHLVDVIREQPSDRWDELKPSISDIWWWADRRTKNEVLDLLDRAADSYQAAES